MGPLTTSGPDLLSLRGLAEASADGLVVLRAPGLVSDRHPTTDAADGAAAVVEWANPAARRILDCDGPDFDSRVLRIALASIGLPVDRSSPEGQHMSMEGEQGRVDISCRTSAIDDERLAVWFRDLREEREQQSRISAIATAALSVADAGSLTTTLNALASEVRAAADLAAVQVVTMHGDGPVLRVVGRAGFMRTEDFTARLQQAEARGAQLALLQAVRENRPIVIPGRKSVILADARWQPMHAIFSQVDWDCFGAFPLTVRDRAVGVLIAFFRPGGDPDERTIEFLSAMADQAALAVDYAGLLAVSRDEGRRRERERIASDLHDSVVQQVFSMRLLATALETSCADHDSIDAGRVRSAAGELVSLCRNTLADLRDLIFELRPADLVEHGLAEAIKVHANAIEARTGLTVAVDVEPGSLSPCIEAQEDIYRIVQEALHNVVKHAGASKVDVRIRTGAEGVEVRVTDNGRGLAPTADGAHVGLTSMRERARRWGASLTIADASEGGVVVRLLLPCGAPAEGECPFDGALDVDAGIPR